MASSLTKPAFHIMLLLVLAIAVSSCGRRGALISPSAIQVDGDKQAEQSSEDAVEEPKEDKPFILDSLL